MISEKLIHDLAPELNNASEVWIAVALMKDSAFDSIQNIISPNCKQHYLVGIDLPTTPSVLRTLMSKLVPDTLEGAIYKSDFNFHPKVYLIKTQDKYVAFVGSSNLTDGGFENNIELNYKITEQEHCIDIREWYTKLFKDAFPLNEENIKIYEEEYRNIKSTEEQNKTRRKSIKLKKKLIPKDSLQGIDFTDRYFKKEHHLAFRKELWLDGSPAANKERKEVSDRLEELHSEIFPKFRTNGIGELMPNVKNHLISLYYQLPDLPPRKLDGMWLSYGKDQSEIKEYHKLFPKTSSNDEDDLQSFINHARVQIKVSYKEIGIWILFGKNNNGSIFDRDYFKNQMRIQKYREEFYQMVSSLPQKYWISVGNMPSEYFSRFSTPEELHDYCKKDNTKEYFIIGRDYEITDNEMSETNLPVTVLQEFKRLFPIYKVMRDKQFANA